MTREMGRSSLETAGEHGISDNAGLPMLPSAQQHSSEPRGPRKLRFCWRGNRLRVGAPSGGEKLSLSKSLVVSSSEYSIGSCLAREMESGLRQTRVTNRLCSANWSRTCVGSAHLERSTSRGNMGLETATRLRLISFLFEGFLHSVFLPILHGCFKRCVSGLLQCILGCSLVRQLFGWEKRSRTWDKYGLQRCATRRCTMLAIS